MIPQGFHESDHSEIDEHDITQMENFLSQQDGRHESYRDDGEHASDDKQAEESDGEDKEDDSTGDDCGKGFDGADEDYGEALENDKNPFSQETSFQKFQSQMSEKVALLEKETMSKRHWTMTGEVGYKQRNVNSLLEQVVEFDQISKVRERK